MVVYADVLLVLNLITDYFLLRLAALFLREHPPFFRLLCAALAGAASSLLALAPKINTFLQLFVQLAVCIVLSLIAFCGFSLKKLLRRTAVVFAVTYGYTGCMLALWFLFRPSGLIISNSVVYIDISPLFLVLFSCIGYFAAALLQKLLKKDHNCAEEYTVRVLLFGREFEFSALADTGNSLEDVFGESEVIIVNPKTADMIFGSFDRQKLEPRFRVLPCATVSGEDILEGFRCDRAYIINSGKSTVIDKPILAISKHSVQEFDAIINPRSVQ